MFTGLVEKVGRLAGVERHAGGYALLVEHAPWDTPLAAGDSVAVNGACLTTTGAESGSFAADLLDDTIRRTTLLECRGRPVNLERAVRANDRFGGHFVTGHVDGVGIVAGVIARGRDHVLSVRCSRDLLTGMVVKGSVACDGVSLTIVRLDAESFDVHIVPYTWEQSALRNLVTGAGVNLETDLIGKYVRRGFAMAGGEGGVTMDGLVRAGILAGQQT